MLERVRQTLRPHQPDLSGVYVYMPYWVRWTYSEEEWKRFDRYDWNRTRRQFYSKILFLALAPLWWIFILNSIPGLIGKAFDWWMLALGFGLAAIMAIIYLDPWMQDAWKVYCTGRERHRVRQAAGTERVLEIGPVDICQSGNCIPINGPTLMLYEVSISFWDPSVLKFRMYRSRLRMFRPSLPLTGINVPIPEGQEESARELVERFRRELQRA